MMISPPTVVEDAELRALSGVDWTKSLKGLLKAELKARDIGYAELARRLGLMGIEESERNLANKISRGGFSAIFLVQCLKAVGCRALEI